MNSSSTSPTNCATDHSSCNLRRTIKVGNLLVLLGLVFLGGAAASEALSSSSFTTKNGRSYVKHNGFAHLNGKTNNNGHANGVKNGVSTSETLNGKNGKTNPNNGFHPISSNNKILMEACNSADKPIHADYVADTKLPTDVGHFQLRAYRVRDVDAPNPQDPYPYQNTNALEPVVIYSTDKPPFGKNGQLSENVPIRVHDQCLTSEVFRSQRCDCKEQLKMSLEYIQEHGGAVIYLQQEGRGIGLANKVAAYALQDLGMDTVDANLHLGFPEDCRKYGVVPSILKDMGIGSVKLMTNNPRKVERLSALGVNIVKTVPILADANPYNRRYLETKQDRMNHSNFGHILDRKNNVQPPRGSIVKNGVMAPRKTFIPDTSSSKAAANAVEVSLHMVQPTLTDEELETAEEDNRQAGVTADSDGYCFGKQSVEDAIAAVARGEMIVVVDDMDRENEGDLIMAADACNPLDMARIVRYSSGVICVAMEGSRMDELKLPAMVTNNEDPKGTAFSVTVDATKEHGISTGISAADRSKTVQLLANPESAAFDFHRPGHLFPLRAREGGVLARDGHTEAAIDFSRLAGRSPCGVLCEIVSEENPTEMMRLPEIKRFCRQHGFVLTSIVDLAQYRRETGQ